MLSSTTGIHYIEKRSSIVNKNSTKKDSEDDLSACSHSYAFPMKLFSSLQILECIRLFN